MKRLGLTLLTFLALANAEALLPPLYESAREIQRLVTDPQLGKKLPTEEIILGIQKNDQGYEIITNHHRLQVDVSYKHKSAKNGRVGPSQIQLHFGDPILLK